MRPNLPVIALALLLAVSASTHRPVQVVVQQPAEPATASRPEAPLPPTPAEELAARQLVVPVRGVARSALKDTFGAVRGKGRSHRAIDIMAPYGTPVLAADEGRIEKITENRAGGLTLYQVDASGRFVYYYAHLSDYVEGLREGQLVKRGEVIGYVGSSGNATTPHLHFQAMVLADGKRWWGGEPVNPYAALARAPNEMGASAVAGARP
jgi:murein DD-endopeptidase MepM/ murein hydrolase activator NlpD